MKPKIPALAIDNHPDMVTNESILLNPARWVHRTAWEAWAKLREAEAVSSDPKRLAGAAAGVLTTVGDTAIKALKELEENQKTLERKLSAEITPATPDAAAAEIRAHWKGQRHPFSHLGELIQSGDRRTIAAVLKAPAYLSGLKDAQQQTLRDLARETWFPEETKTIADIGRAAGRVTLLLGAVKSTLEPLIKEWSGEKEEAAFAKLGNGGAA